MPVRGEEMEADGARLGGPEGGDMRLCRARLRGAEFVVCRL